MIITQIIIVKIFYQNKAGLFILKKTDQMISDEFDQHVILYVIIINNYDICYVI